MYNWVTQSIEVHICNTSIILETFSTTFLMRCLFAKFLTRGYPGYPLGKDYCFLWGSQAFVFSEAPVSFSFFPSPLLPFPHLAPTHLPLLLVALSVSLDRVSEQSPRALPAACTIIPALLRLIA